MVQNIMITRFANAVWEPLWNRYYISCVLITFKEDIGIEVIYYNLKLFNFFFIREEVVILINME